MEAWKTKEYTTMTFCDVWEDVDSFLEDYTGAGIPETISETNATTLYYLLYARFANRPILNLDLTQWKYKILSVIYTAGPAWEKRLAVQNSLRSLSDTELLEGSKAVYNHAFNPSAEPGTDTSIELNYINEQNVTKMKKGKLDGYAMLLELLKTDVTTDFLAKFEKCFSKFINRKPLLYVTEEEEDE